MSAIDPRTPVLIGCGQSTWRGAPDRPTTYKSMLVEAGRAALADTGADVGGAIDTVAVVRFWVDSLPFDTGVPRLTNPPRSLAQALGLAPRTHAYTAVGGNTPQMLVNRYADAIARGEVETVLIAGAEAHRSLAAVQKTGGDLSAWGEERGVPDLVIGDDRPGMSPHELAHGVGIPSSTYPLFEEAYRKHRGRSRAGHKVVMGALMSRLSEVAADNPLAWFPVKRSPEEIVRPSPENRMISTPYTKFMNAVDSVDQSAALVLTSAGRAEALGVPRGKWVFLHGAAEANEIWHVSDRVDFHSCGAIRAMVQAAMEMARIGLPDIAAFDLYSCFPVAIEIACAEIGLHEDDPRGVSVTGGLPYFGGPGNNYVTHSIATMMERLRARPGAYGLVTANGWYLTKHACGIYSTRPPDGPWTRPDMAALQARLDAREHPAFTETPHGRGKVETCTVFHDRAGPRKVILYGRLEDGRRFLANTPREAADILERFDAEDLMGARGTVERGPDGRNQFVPG